MSRQPAYVLEKKILSRLLYAESFETIIEETREKEPIVGRCLKWLITNRLVTPMAYDEKISDYKPTFMYDSDNMHACRYRITAEGLNFLNSKN